MIRIELIDRDSDLYIERNITEEELIRCTGRLGFLDRVSEVVGDIREVYPNHSVPEALDEFLTVRVTQV